MSDIGERMSESARRHKRNLMLFSALSWAVAIGWIVPVHNSSAPSSGFTATISGFGIGVTDTGLAFGLLILVSYSLMSFWIHGPFGEPRKEGWLATVVTPFLQDGFTAEEFRTAIQPVARYFNQDLSKHLQGMLADFDRITAEKNFRHTYQRDPAKGFLIAVWDHLNAMQRLRIRFRSLKSRRARIVLIHDFWEITPAADNRRTIFNLRVGLASQKLNGQGLGGATRQFMALVR